MHAYYFLSKQQCFVYLHLIKNIKLKDLLSQLQQFYKEEPTDPFNIYALATEYLKTDLIQSKLLFEELLNNHSAYIATYYHAAALYMLLNETPHCLTGEVQL